MSRSNASLSSFIVAVTVTLFMMALVSYSNVSHYQRVMARAGAGGVVGDFGLSIAADSAEGGPLPIDDPHAERWDRAPSIDVPLLPQNIAMPTVETAEVGQVNVRALSDGRRIAFRISWADETADMNVDAGRFCDAVAIQFPLDTAAPFTMGVRGMKVQILHWKAVWQKDIDEHFQDVQDLHPNYWADLYWFADPIEDEAGLPTYRVPDSFENPTAKQWFTAHAADNPMARFRRRKPVEELVAEGFGTLTNQPQSASSGRGVWKDGRWAVVFSRPLSTEDALDYQFRTGGLGSFGVAVWEGSAGHVGGRKQWSNWVPFELRP